MSTRPLTLAIAGLIAGIALGYLVAYAQDDSGGSPRSDAWDRGEPAERELGELRAAHERLRTRHEELQREHEELRQRTARAKATTGDATDEAKTPAPDRAGHDPVVSFDRWRDEPALRTADWREMGNRAADLVRARKTGIAGGTPREMQALSRKARRELLRHLGSIGDKRKELRGHPVVLVNLMASHLERAGLPLQPRQITAIEAAGRRYEAAAAELQRELSSPLALATENKLRDIKLRKAHVDRIVDDVLTKEQWNVLFDPKTKGLLYYDVYQVGGLELERPHSSVYWRNVRKDAREHLRFFLLTEWEIPRSDLQKVEPIIDQWIDAIRNLPRFTGHPSSALHIEEVLPCADVHVRFQKRVLAALAHDADRVRRIRENAIYVIFPRLRNPG